MVFCLQSLSILEFFLEICLSSFLESLIFLGLKFFLKRPQKRLDSPIKDILSSDMSVERFQPTKLRWATFRKLPRTTQKWTKARGTRHDWYVGNESWNAILLLHSTAGYAPMCIGLLLFYDDKQWVSDYTCCWINCIIQVLHRAPSPILNFIGNEADVVETYQNYGHKNPKPFANS